MKRLILILSLFLTCRITASALELQIGYEPFLIKQFNREIKTTYLNGTATSLELNQGEVNLLFHLLSLRVKQTWEGFQRTFFGIETGLSASPMPVIKEWRAASPNGFTGTISLPSVSNTADFWQGRDLEQGTDNPERYLIEETFLSYIPLTFLAERQFFSRENLFLNLGLNAGFALFHIDVIRKRLSGSPQAIYMETERSKFHASRILGGRISLGYKLTSTATIFVNTDFNAVGNLTDLQFPNNATFRFVEGYRFDGLRYNYKLGVSWKI